MEDDVLSAEEKSDAGMNQRRPRGAFLATLQVLSVIPLPILRLRR
jgi:hypothetical protein